MISVKRDGYNFVGWKSNLDKKIYKSGDKVILNNNLVLTAQWELISEKQKDTDSSKQPVTEKNTSQGSHTSTQQPTSQSQTSEPQKPADTATKKTSTEKVKAPSKVSLKSAKNEKSKKLTVKWRKVKDAKGYQVEYALNNKFTKSKKSKTIKGNSNKSLTFTAKNLKKSKVYYVRVRAYKTDAKGKKVYGKWSTVKKVTIKK